MPRFTQTGLAAALLSSAALLSACDQAHSVHASAPPGTVAAQVQPVPDKPLFNEPIVKSHDVLPHAKADTQEPLPPAVALASATAPSASATPTDAQGGGVNPAAGMGAAITDSKGAQHEADGKP